MNRQGRGGRCGDEIKERRCDCGSLLAQICCSDEEHYVDTFTFFFCRGIGGLEMMRNSDSPLSEKNLVSVEERRALAKERVWRRVMPEEVAEVVSSDFRVSLC